jgi:iron complex outermembrane recepter protein
MVISTNLRWSVVLALSAVAGVAPAADLLDEIVVTAQKREQNLQDVGIAVTAFTGDQLKDLGFSDAISVVAQTPGLAVARPGSGAINIFSIRGVTQADFAANQEGPVAVYVDEAYVSQNTVSNFTMFDLERVEVLRGPQGTLFGRNATGGLVQYVTVKPSQERSAFIEAQVGSQGRRRIEAAAGGGLADGVAVRVAGVWNESDGLMKNRIGPDGQAADDWAARLQLLFEPNEDLSILLKGEIGKDDSARGSYAHRVGFGGAFTPAPATDFFGYRNPDEGDLWAGDWDFDGFNEADVSHLTARLNWRLGAFDLSYVGDYQDIKHRYGEDSEGSPANVFNYTQVTDVQQWSQELRLSWRGERTRAVGGLFLLNIDGDFDQDSLVFGQEDFDWANAFYGIPEPGGYNLVTAFQQETKTVAAFGQVEFDLTDQMMLTVGGRWTRDKKDYAFTQAWTGADGLYVFFENAGPGTVPYFDYSDSFSKSDWSGKAQLDYRPNDDLLIYGSVNRGIKSGGFNAPVDASGLLAGNEFGQFIPFAQDDAAMRYDGEVLTTVEAGFKSTLLGGRARLNAAAFYYDYNDYQIYNLVGLTQIVFNSDGRMWGGEVELVASPTDGLDLMLGVSLLDSSVDLPPGIRLDGGLKSDSALAPKWTFNGLARYEWPAFGDGRFNVQTDFFWKDSQIFNLSNTPVVREGSYLVANASIGYTGASGAWYASAFVKNLFDKEYREYAFDLTGGFGNVASNGGPERWYGVTLGYRWR